jgi:hypothetical protein
MVKRDYDSIHDVLTSPSILAIVVGGIMAMTALVGLIGSAVSNLWSLRVVSKHVCISFHCRFQASVALTATEQAIYTLLANLKTM